MDNLDAVRLKLLEEELECLRQVLLIYANQENWHNKYDITNSPAGEGLALVWARQENGWELAAAALGEY